MNEMEAGVLCELSDLYAEYGDRTMLGGMWQFALQRAEFLRELGDAETAKRWDDVAVSLMFLLCFLYA